MIWVVFNVLDVWRQAVLRGGLVPHSGGVERSRGNVCIAILRDVEDQPPNGCALCILRRSAEAGRGDEVTASQAVRP